MVADETIWNAVAQIMAKDPAPLRIDRIAHACNMSSTEVTAALIREAKYPRLIQFRYASTVPAVISIHNPTQKRP